MTAWTTDLPADSSSPGAARRWLRGRLDVGELGAEIEVGDIELCVSELVSNAVLHAGTDCRLRITTEDGRVRVEIHDGDARRLPAKRAYDQASVTGRGLHLVERLSARWGVDVDGEGKTVWFEVDRTERAGQRA